MKKTQTTAMIVFGIVIANLFIYAVEVGKWDYQSILNTSKELLLIAVCTGIVVYIVESYKERKKKSEQYSLPEMDERTEKNGLKFMAQMFGLSHLIGILILGFLTIKDYDVISVKYVLYYVLGVLFFTMTIGIIIVSKR